MLNEFYEATVRLSQRVYFFFPDPSTLTLIPILQCHGDCDPVVPYKWGQLTSTILKRIVKEHEFKTYR